MTATLIVLAPLALLALVATFCFVGCGLDVTGSDYGKPPKPVEHYTQYSDNDVGKNINCVAYWPLNDSKGQTTALDVAGKALNIPHNGTYRSVDIPADKHLFPCFGFNLAAGVDTAKAEGILTLQAPGIAPGDTVPPNDPVNPISAPAMSCDGAFVSVPPNSVVTKVGPFSVEAWALPAWSANDPGVFHSLIDSRDNGAAGLFGFAIWVNEAGMWEAVINCTNSKSALVTGFTASLKDVTHIVLVLTDANEAKLYINGVAANTVPLPQGETFSPNTTKPFVIGVGAPWLEERQQETDQLFFPIFPFKGTIQDVAIYNAALTDQVVSTHYQHGLGEKDD